MSVRRASLFGLPVDLLTMRETVQEIAGYFERGELCTHVVINVPKAMMAQNHERLAAVIRRADIVNADGTWIAVGARVAGVRVPQRFTGFDLMQELVSWAEENRLSVYLLGGTDEVVSKVAATYRRRYPRLQLAGWRNGYFSDEESEEIASRIRDSGAQVVFLGFPTPAKEYWLDGYAEGTGAGLVMGVGGSFDVIAGVKSRAPAWVQKIGMEWFWRLVQEPRRMWRRYLLNAPRFMALALRERRNKRRQTP